MHIVVGGFTVPEIHLPAGHNQNDIKAKENQRVLISARRWCFLNEQHLSTRTGCPQRPTSDRQGNGAILHILVHVVTPSINPAELPQHQQQVVTIKIRKSHY